eukprot:TRINITY_DN28655_c0_g1_i1.p2 TRINITY_DN28655_c0_g1~~TRINITY_DN28655_c0_g1_i1.p2  ORF type:complete len:228 (+),score=71.59 TRINITY_DN28655_c0_g1_i1:96-779(+)
MDGADPVQIELMKEECILVSPDDEAIGHDSKKACHLKPGKLHRAFSVFLINSKGELLLQRRAPAKITFPNLWTNTCCSHPLWRDEEREEKDQLGVKRAAIRKLEHELGIPANEVPIEKFHFVTRIHYMADSDTTWVEHEVDYILFIQADVTLKPEENEVCDTKWVSQEEMKALLADTAAHVDYTPWFLLVVKNILYDLWDEWLEVAKNGGDISTVKTLGETKIHKFV